MSKKLTTANEKGGVGKTTVTATVAAGLAQRGYKVLAIDADAQGHLTRAFGLAKYPGLYDFLVRDAEYTSVIKGVPAERYGGQGASNLYLLGSNVETRNIAGSIGDAWALADRLAPLEDLFDFCVIDTAPTPSLLHGAIYLATDMILYPTLCEFWSFDGLAESMTHRRDFQNTKPVKVAGIIPTRYRSQTLEHSENLAKLRAQFGAKVWEPLSERIVWAEASSKALPVFVYDPDGPAARDAWALVERVEALYVNEA
jgi:chromosome partitioning protein